MNFWKLAQDIQLAKPPLDSLGGFQQPALLGTYTRRGDLVLGDPGAEAMRHARMQPHFYRSPHMVASELNSRRVPAAALPYPASMLPPGMADTAPPQDPTKSYLDGYMTNNVRRTVSAPRDPQGNVSLLSLYHEKAHQSDPAELVTRDLEREIPAAVADTSAYMQNELPYTPAGVDRAQTVVNRMAQYDTSIPPWVYSHMLKYGPKVRFDSPEEDAKSVRDWIRSLRRNTELGNKYRAWAASPAVGPVFKAPPAIAW
jgi:hypothetical protein